MPIKVTCRCGQQFAAKDELAGKVVKCPKCQESLKVGAAPPPQAGARPAAQAAVAAPSAVAKLLDEVGFHRHDKEDEGVQHCPACDQTISDHAVLCVYCGYHLESGKFVKGMGGVGPAAQKVEGHEAAALMLLKKAERAISQDKDEERKIRTQGMPVWVLAMILAALLSFGVCMSFYDASTALRVSGFVLALSSIVVTLVAAVLIRVAAFKDAPKEGWMCLFVPFYDAYYSITHWGTCGRPFMIMAVCLGAAFGGGAVYGMGVSLSGGSFWDSISKLFVSDNPVFNSKRSILYSGQPTGEADKCWLVVRVRGNPGTDVHLLAGSVKCMPEKRYSSNDKTFCELAFKVPVDAAAFALVDGDKTAMFIGDPNIRAFVEPLE